MKECRRGYFCLCLLMAHIHTPKKLSPICKLNTWGVNGNFKAHEQYLSREQGCVVWCGTSRWWLKKTSNVKFLTGDLAREGYIENSCQQICSKEPLNQALRYQITRATSSLFSQCCTTHVEDSLSPSYQHHHWLFFLMSFFFQAKLP